MRGVVPRARTGVARSRPRGSQKPLSRPDDSIDIPDKLYFKIGEVAQLTGVEPYILRYWETEFGSLRPAKSRSGQRLYRRGDVLAVLRIKDLLYRQRFTIAGAKRHLAAVEGNLPATVLDSLRRLKDELKEISLLLRKRSP
ncbi:MAG: MerR family transcriptional regulator [Candidatus Methylomirabilis oxyfera]|nr:MerR family transcriptional regulator [Candidatus Methylomirabilis oxyfera]